MPCYKMEVAMNVETWYFLHGTTNGVCNLTYFLSLLSGLAVTEVSKTKRGLGYVFHPGQVNGSRRIQHTNKRSRHTREYVSTFFTAKDWKPCEKVRQG